jgi:hypothetical protein
MHAFGSLGAGLKLRKTCQGPGTPRQVGVVPGSDQGIGVAKLSVGNEQERRRIVMLKKAKIGSSQTNIDEILRVEERAARFDCAPTIIEAVV